MDPYLEQPGLWEQVHTRLIVAIADFLAPQLRPNYHVDIEQRVYIDSGLPTPADFLGKPDVVVTGRDVTDFGPVATLAGPAPLVAELPGLSEITERYLEIREVATGLVITVIEVLSPSNKRPNSEGRREYEAKRLKVLRSLTNLIEIDLIRAYGPLPMRLRSGSPGAYRVLVRRSNGPGPHVYPFTVRDPIPAFPVPLLPTDAEPTVPLNQLVHDLYDRAGYDLSVNYRQPPEPPLATADAEWAMALIQSALQA